MFYALLLLLLLLLLSLTFSVVLTFTHALKG